MYAGIGAGLRGNKLGGLADVDVALVAVVVLPAFFRPEGINVFIVPAWQRSSPNRWGRDGFDDLVVLAFVALDGHGNKGCINDLATFEFAPQRGQHLIETLEQLIDQLVFFERLTEGSHGAGIRCWRGKAIRERQT
ncbi:MAG: hypothetical protein ABL892_00635 [Thiobacillaceae bacterium]